MQISKLELNRRSRSNRSSVYFTSFLSYRLLNIKILKNIYETIKPKMSEFWTVRAITVIELGIKYY